jgi:hypothetical protein
MIKVSMWLANKAKEVMKPAGDDGTFFQFSIYTATK